MIVHRKCIGLGCGLNLRSIQLTPVVQRIGMLSDESMNSCQHDQGRQSLETSLDTSVGALFFVRPT